jgi:hypothetical protein
MIDSLLATVNKSSKAKRWVSTQLICMITRLICNLDFNPPVGAVVDP